MRPSKKTSTQQLSREAGLGSLHTFSSSPQNRCRIFRVLLLTLLPTHHVDESSRARGLPLDVMLGLSFLLKSHSKWERPYPPTHQNDSPWETPPPWSCYCWHRQGAPMAATAPTVRRQIPLYPFSSPACMCCCAFALAGYNAEASIESVGLSP